MADMAKRAGCPLGQLSPLSRLLAAHQQRPLSDELPRNDSVRRPNLLAPQGTFENTSSPLSGRRSEAPSQFRALLSARSVQSYIPPCLARCWHGRS